MYPSVVEVVLKTVMIISLVRKCSSNVWYSKEIDVFCEKEDYSVQVEHPGCPSQDFLVKACLGNCRSFELPIQNSPFFKSKCETCRAKHTEKKAFRLHGCAPGVNTLVHIESALSCECTLFECF